ncbi:MAG: hypothetical protein HYT41_01970 [Candidatus Sungbacteria bacterium]|nr:hypothetical protein [Candidatus Sungbacteria bacterium]
MPDIAYSDVREAVAEYLGRRLMARNPYVIGADDGPLSRMRILMAITDLAWNPLPAFDVLSACKASVNNASGEARTLALWINVLGREAKARKSVRPSRKPMTGASFAPIDVRK